MVKADKVIQGALIRVHTAEKHLNQYTAIVTAVHKIDRNNTKFKFYPPPSTRDFAHSVQEWFSEGGGNYQVLVKHPARMLRWIYGL